MSKYHKLQAAIAKRDWTTTEGIAAGLRSELKLEGYGTKFQAWQGGVPIDEEAVRQAIIGEVTAPPVIERYQQILQKMAIEDSLGGYGVYVEADPGVTFKHGDFEHPASLGEFEVVTGEKEVERRRKRTTKTDIKKEDRAKKLKEKLDDTRNTDEDFYLFHASQCGYLVRNTAIRFYNTARDQWGISMMTRINGITLPKLQEFIDSAGRGTLSMISTHMDPSLVKTTEPGEDSEGGVLAMHSDFAKEIVDFLNLEYEVDIDDLKRQHTKADSGFRSIGYWIEQSGGDEGMVLAKLIERRPGGLDPDRIKKLFELGYETESPATEL